MQNALRNILNHINGLGATLALYCLVVPTAWADLQSPTEPMSTKLLNLGWRGAGIYLCFLFVYFLGLRTGRKKKMPETGAYGGYSDTDESGNDVGAASEGESGETPAD